MIAAEAGHHQVLRVLLENGAAVEARDGFGMSALHFAVQKGLKMVV